MTEKFPAENIFEQLIGGTRSFRNLEELRDVMQTYPETPWFHRIMADFLKRNKSFVEAEKHYNKSHLIFMEQGRTPQAIAALLRGWNIIRPTPHDFRSLHVMLRRKNSHSSALAECFAKMSYQELSAVLKCISLVKYPAHQVLRKAGESESTLFFVVYGNLISSPPGDNAPTGGDSARILKENDFFGDPRPYSEELSVGNLVKTLTEVELIQISKPDMLTLCGEFPDLQNGLKNLMEDHAQAGEHKAKFYRKTSRRKLAITLYLDILDREPGKHPITVKCYTSDMSLGGVCVFVDPRYRDLPIEDLVNRRTKLRISLPDESISLSILSRLAWYKESDMDGEDTYAIGIQFNEMPPRLRGLLIVFANAVGSMNRQMQEQTFYRND